MISVNIVIHFPYIHRSVIPAIRVKLYLLTKITILTLPLSLSVRMFSLYDLIAHPNLAETLLTYLIFIACKYIGNYLMFI